MLIAFAVADMYYVSSQETLRGHLSLGENSSRELGMSTSEENSSCVCERGEGKVAACGSRPGSGSGSVCR